MANQQHHLGHRQRLRQRFLQGGDNALADYELLELLLFGANPRQDVKPLAKQLLTEFGSLAAVFNAEVIALQKVDGIGDSAIAILKSIHIAAQRMLKDKVMEQPLFNAAEQVVDYCRTSMEWLKTEQLRLLFVDKKNRMIADEVQQTGTIDSTAIYPREVVKRALDLAASAIIMVHNHPSGDPSPSQADLEITKQVNNACTQLGLHLLDHIIIGKGRHFSFKAQGRLKGRV